MSKRTRILFLSANPWTTSRILVDEEAREISERLQEGSHRDKFELQTQAATRVIDLQRHLLTFKPHIVHFSAHGSKRHKVILGGNRGRGKEVDPRGLVELFALYRSHVRLVFLNACFTKAQALSLCQVIDYSVGSGKMIGDKSGVAFAGAFYRALGFGKSVPEAFQSAKVELALTRMPRSKGLELFVRDGVRRDDAFPRSQTRTPRQPSPRATAATLACDSRCCTALSRGSDLRHGQPSLSESREPRITFRDASVREAGAWREQWYEHVRSVRTEAVVPTQCSSPTKRRRQEITSKSARRSKSGRERPVKRNGRVQNAMGESPFTSETITVCRVTERFELRTSNAPDERPGRRFELDVGTQVSFPSKEMTPR